MTKNTVNYPLQTATVAYNAPRQVNIGDVFYMIAAVDLQTFREPCIVCKGARKLTVNGVTFSCPCCDDSKEVISLRGYVVHRYRVFRISDEVNNSEWKAATNHAVRFGLYRKVGHGYQWESHSQKEMGKWDLCKYFNITEENVTSSLIDKYIYDDYALAVRAAKALTDQELQKLADYNVLHGTKHEAVFKTENDKKSS